MKLPKNLRRLALDDFGTILAISRRDFGPRSALELQRKLLRHFAAIASGRCLGHQRFDAPYDPTIRFINLPPYPFVIIYDSEANVVLRIVDGRRDFRDLIF